MGMGIKSLKWEGIGTKNLFPHTSIAHSLADSDVRAGGKAEVCGLCRVNNGSMGHGSMGQMGQFLDGSYGSWVDALSPMTHLHIYERHFSAFNARHMITSQRNLLLPETVEALSIVFEGYKNKLLQ